jgi:hypothetical protein
MGRTADHPAQLRRRRQTFIRVIALVAAASAIAACHLMNGAAFGHERPAGNRLAVTVTRVLAPMRLEVRPTDETNPAAFIVELGGLAASSESPGETDDFLTQSVVGSRVTLHLIAGTIADPIVGYVELNDGRILNEWMLEQGFAIAADDASHAARRWYIRIENERRRAGDDSIKPGPLREDRKTSRSGPAEGFS